MGKGLRYGITAVIAALAIGAVAFQARQRVDEAGSGSDVPLFTNLGAFQRQVSTSDATAQQYFDQGLRLTYGFNHEEAINSFSEALRRDPQCAMCAWGIAYAYGPNINAPMDSASGVLAYEAVQRALSLVEHATPVERALIEALAQRYAPVPGSDRAALDASYANAMREVRAQFPDDFDVLTLHAEAVMDTRPWDYWDVNGAPREGTAELVADLERVMAADPAHPGACHYYIHAVEAVYPERAVECAERLASLMPGAGHIVHMPAHIYIRTGRWADAITANEHAVHTDETYLADRRPSGIYPFAYYPHNYHFLSFAATMAGRSAQAISAARSAVAAIPIDVARGEPVLEILVPFTHLTLVTFGRWEEVLSEPAPPADLRFATAMVHYARGVAHAATRDAAAARASLDTVQAVQRATVDELQAALLDIASHALAGEIAFRSGDLRSAESHFRLAKDGEDALMYMEPPFWYYPIRHSLGAVLLAAGQPAQAEAVYREDLRRFPDNAWSLQGLAEALRARGRTTDADAAVATQAQLASDIGLTGSRF